MSKAMKDGKKGLVPRLRFPEFRDAGEWEEKLLREVITVLQGYGFPTAMQGKDDGKYPFCKVSDISRAVAEQGGMLADAANHVDDVDVSKLRAKLIPIGATVFAKIGEALRLNRRAFVHRTCLIDNNAVGLKAIEGVANDYFIYLLSQLIDLNQHCGGAVPSVNKSTLEAINVVLPKPEEQQKIADCLSSLDALIAAQADNIDALKTHKKGLMQQLFPREGETVPRLRFSEFREAGEWRIKPLEKICEVLNNRRKPITSSNRVSGPYPYYGASGIVDYVADFIFDDRLVLVGEDGAKWGAFEKTAFIAEGKYWVNNHAHVLKSLGLNDVLLEAYLTMLDVGPYITGAAPPKLTLGKLKQIPITVPALPEEQQKIADCLSSLDALIAAHTEKLDALKSHKKGLMQQLFPRPEVVGA